MTLYILKPIKEWECWFDKAFGHVIRAESEERARKIASEEAGDEGADVWLDPKITSCEVLKDEGEEELIIRDYWKS